MKDITTKNEDGSVTVVREMDPMDEMRHREEDAALDKLEAKINDPYPDSIPFDEFDQKPYADSVTVTVGGDTKFNVVVPYADSGVTSTGNAYGTPKPDMSQTAYWELKDEYDKVVEIANVLTAHLVSKGCGSAAIRRILAGEVVR